MGEDLNRRAHTIFKRVIDLDPGDRTAIIDDACGDDAQLRQSVLALVSALDDTQGFLEVPALESPSWEVDQGAANVNQPDIHHGERINGYRIESVIGVGGMATVYKALQERPRRHVALKVMKRGLLGTSALRRFEYETEVLARLRHPGIAQIYETGAFDEGGKSSVPYFALEYIDHARPLTTYAEEESLSLEQRLTMFAGVCDAVQHGHANGVVHRDLKPGNILVDADGRAKVIDFGIARSTDPEHELMTRHTDVGQLIGTLNYMSPEQCSLAPSNLDVRTDVYSLGVVLYELLCGRLPHDLNSVPVPEAMRKIQQDEPIRPGAIHPSLRGDLDAIIGKAIDKDPERRYRSAAELGNDLRHYLRHETIEARPPTALYQLRRFTQRNRALVASTLIVIVTLAVTTTISVRSALLAKREAGRRAVAQGEALSERDVARWQAYIATVAAAQGAYESGEFHRMRTRLNLAPAEHRGWEWHLLNSLANTSIDTIVAHEGLIMTMVGDAERSRLATGCADGTIRIWDTGTQFFKELDGRHDARVRSLDYSPDGDRLISGALDGTVNIWDPGTGRLLRTLERRHDEVVGVAFTWDGRMITVTPRHVRIWDDRSEAPIGEIGDLPGALLGGVIDRDRRHMMVFGESGAIVIHDLERDEPTLQFDHGGEVNTAVFSDDGHLIASGGIDGKITVWNVETGRLLHVLQGRSSVIRSLAFTHDGKVLATGQGVRDISLWSMDTGQSIAVLRGHADAVSGLQFSADDSLLYSSSWDRTIRVWDLEDPDPITTFQGHEDTIVATTFSPDGSMIASGGMDRSVRLWDPVLGIELGVLRGHRDRVYAVAFAPDGRHLYSGAYDRLIRVWDLVTGAEGEPITGNEGGIWSIKFSPDGRHFASCGDDRTIRLFDLESRTLIRTLRGHEERVDDIAFSPDGATLASASRDQSVRLWDVDSGNEIRRFDGHKSDVFAVLFSPDGEHLISGSRDQSVRIWDIQSGACILTHSEHGQFITSLSLSPDGTRLAAGSWFREILLWDMRSGDAVMNFAAHDDAIRSIGFGPQGRRLVSCSYDKTVRVWDSADRRERRREREAAQRAFSEARAIVDSLFQTHGSAAGVAVAIEQDVRLQGDLLPWARKCVLMHSLGMAGEAAPAGPDQPPR